MRPERERPGTGRRIEQCAASDILASMGPERERPGTEEFEAAKSAAETALQ